MRGPYLQLSTPTSIAIRWRTDVTNDSLVAYGTNLASLAETNFSATPLTNHEIVLTNLSPDTLYYYSVGSSTEIIAGPGTNNSFLTHPLPGSTKPLRLWVIGDSGTGYSDQYAVRDTFSAYNGTNRINAWLQLGDNAYFSGYDDEFQEKMFNVYSNILLNTVAWSTLGNHDSDQLSDYVDTYPYFQIYKLPMAGEAGGVPSGTGHYYSFDLGMAHFVCLDSMTADRSPNGAMATWLQADLAANTNRWLIAFWHHPPYTKGNHDSDAETKLTEMRQNFNPMLEAAGVDLVLTGHSHVYERSFFLNGHYGTSLTLTTNMIVQPGDGRETNGVGAYLKTVGDANSTVAGRGTVYSVVGSSGHISGGPLNHPAMAVSLNVLGSMVLTITTNRLDGVFLRENIGVSNDWFTIRKDNYIPLGTNPVATIASILIAADVSTNLTVTGTDANASPLTFTPTALPTNGLLANFNASNGTFTYTPAHGSTNSDALIFIANNGQTNSLPGQLTITVAPPVDANLNGIPEAWETRYGIINAAADDDGDGASNLQEYWAGTNPTNALSWLHFTQIGKAGAGYQVVWSSVGGTRYRVLFSNGDASGNFNGVFTSVPRPISVEMAPNPVGVAGTMSFTDDFILTGIPPSRARFYRVQVVR